MYFVLKIKVCSSRSTYYIHYIHEVKGHTSQRKILIYYFNDLSSSSEVVTDIYRRELHL